MPIENDGDVAKADALLMLVKDLGDVPGPARDASLRVSLAAALDVTNPGWRAQEAFAARIREIGVPAAAEGLLKTYGLVTE